MVATDYMVEVWDMGTDPDERTSLVCRVPAALVEQAYSFEALGWFLEIMQHRMVEAGAAPSNLQWYAWRMQPTQEQVQSNGSS